MYVCVCVLARDSQGYVKTEGIQQRASSPGVKRTAWNPSSVNG